MSAKDILPSEYSILNKLSLGVFNEKKYVPRTYYTRSVKMRIRFAMHLSRALKDAECSIIWPIILIILISLFGRNLFGDSVLLETLWCDCGVIEIGRAHV